jgi:hypothetical protein
MGVPATKRNAKNIIGLGSGRMLYREVNADGTLLDAAQQTLQGYGGAGPSAIAYDWLQMPIVKDSNLKDDTAIEKKADEGGDKYPIEGEREVTLEITSMQRDTKTVRAIVKDMRGKYFELLKENTSRKLADGYQYLYVAIAQVEPKLDFKLPNAEPKFLFNALVVSTAIANRDLSGITGMRSDFTGKNVSVESGEYYEFLDIA